MGQLYHTSCFLCSVCRKTLRGKAFYEVQGRIFCEDDYARSGLQQLAVMCDACGLHIIDLAVQALGKTYHRTCFRCFSCNQCLDSQPYTVDADRHILCLTDYYR
jgi:LIM domain-containing protein